MELHGDVVDGQACGLRGRFVEELSDSYQRNNKKTGQKNIRCFPNCSPKGHLNSGFCGSYLTALISLQRVVLSHQAVRVWGEFVQRGADTLLIPGSKLSVEKAIDSERSRAAPLLPWVRGEVSLLSSGELQITFNRHLLGWHYSWAATKHTSQTLHSFKLQVFVLDQYSQEMEYCGSVLTKPFKLYSRKRNMNEVSNKRAKIDHVTQVKWTLEDISKRRDITIDRIMRLLTYFATDDDSKPGFAVKSTADQELDMVLAACGDDLDVDIANDEDRSIKTFAGLIPSMGAAILESQKDEFENLVNGLQECLKFVHSVSVDRRDFRNFVEKWKHPNMIQRLHEESKSEALVNIIHPDGTVQQPVSGGSMIEELFKLHSDAGEDILVHSGRTWEEYEVFCDKLCQLHVLPCDSFYPPTTRYAALVHIQLHGTLLEFKKQDFGSTSGCFKDTEQAIEWSTAYWKMRRANLSKSISSAILYRPVDRLPPGNPVAANVDMSGVWFNVTNHSGSHGHMANQSQESGWARGGFSTKLFEAMWSTATIKMNSSAIVLQGQRVLLADPIIVFTLDKVPRRRQTFQPLPSALHTTSVEDVTWIHTNEHGLIGVNFVSKAPSKPWQIEEFYKQQPNAGNSNILICRRVFLSKDLNKMYVSIVAHMFSKDKTPSLTDTESLEKLFETRLNSEIGVQNIEFSRIFEGNQVDSVLDTELLDLLNQ